MDTLGKRLASALALKGWEPTDLIQRKILSKAGVYQWLGDKVRADTVRGSNVEAVAKALGVNREWLLSGRGDMYPVRSANAANDDSEWDDLLAYSQAAGLSDGEEAQEYAETHKLKFRSESLSRKRLNPRNLAVMYGKGDSMEPRIHSGDAVLFDQADTRPVDGGIFVILVPGAGAESYSVKRCELIDDMVFFKADNPNGDHGWRKPKRMDNKRHPIKIIGRVRWIGSWEE